MTFLPWLILFTPLLSAAVITLVTRPNRHLSGLISVGAAAIAFIASCIVFAGADQIGQFPWLDFGTQLQVPIGFTIDQLSKTMLIVVTGVGLVVHVYSLGYMEEDDGKSRYFAGLSLFMFSMLGIVLANNFVMMFIFWELVGVSSWLLIGHWFTRPAPPAAANKAFIVNRLGDFGFMLGILLVFSNTGTVMFANLREPTTIGALTSNPALLTVAVLLIFCGAVGKSAQFPLHVWLPDAMEGPTPVSALIHAATMVAAGVYMLARIFFLIEVAPQAQEVIMWIGTITAVLAALMATQQRDIKRILAYSTLSQLGYMVMAIGLAASAAAMFHLFTHAFFKALLFLGSGAVIYAMHHEQDIWKMGGLKDKMPKTFITFVIGTLALTGCPLLAGSFSKDAIIEAAHARNGWVFAAALIVAVLTAFYMFRLVIVAFFGRARSESARHGHEAPPIMTWPLIILAIPSVIAGYGFIIRYFVPQPHGEEHGLLVPMLAFVAFAIGGLAAFFLYRNKDEDPISIPLFANRFYIDEFYKTLVASTQDLLARVSAAFDRWILDGLGVGGLSGGAWGLGFVLRFFQMGNLQAYAFLFGLGVIALIYYAIFTH